MNEYNWIEQEMKSLGHPTSKEITERCIYIMHERDECKKLGIDYNKLDLDDRRKIYWSVLVEEMFWID